VLFRALPLPLTSAHLFGQDSSSEWLLEEEVASATAYLDDVKASQVLRDVAVTCVVQDEPSGCVCTRQPMVGSQNASKHGPSSVGQVSAVPLLHVPELQVSAPLQAFPSPQTIGVPAMQALLTQRSTPLQFSPSEHCASLPQAKPRHLPLRHTS
jgi:hypothetical protein